MTEQMLGWTWVAKQLAVVKQTCFKCVLKNTSLDDIMLNGFISL